MSGAITFVGRPVLEALTHAEVRAKKSSVQLYKLREEFTCVLPSFGLDESRFGPIVVPARFETDFASVPRFALWYVDDDAPCILYGAIIHDYLYSVSGRLPRRHLTRAECDQVLRQCMLACGARSRQAAVVYAAVRIGGGSHWAKEQNERKAKNENWISPL